METHSPAAAPLDNPLAVIILNMNGCDVLVDCLESIRKSRYTNFFTIVVDNASTDNTVETLTRDFPEVEVISLPQNLGFTGGNNKGMERALQRGAGALLLLNNDTILHEDCLGEMMRCLDSAPDIGAVTPKILFHTHPDHIWCAGGAYSLWVGIARHYGLRDSKDDPRYAEEKDVGFATGCSLLVKREVAEKIGLLDDDLFIYNEDGDYSLRVRKAGYRIRYTPTSIMWHREGWDSRRSSGQQRRLHLCTRNILRVHKKHRTPLQALTFYPWFTWRWVILAGGNAIARRDFDTFKGIIAGIKAYRKNETGPVINP